MSDIVKQETNASTKEDTISLLDIFSIIVKRRWLIIVTTFAAAIFILTVAILSLRLPKDSKWNLLPNYYQSTVQIFIQESEGSLSSSISGSQSALSILMGGAAVKNPNLELAERLLAGNTIKDRIAEEFDFFERYKLAESKHPKSTARDIIGGSLEVKTAETGASNIFILSYTGSDPVFATQVLNRITELLEERFRDLSIEKVYRKKQFIEDRLSVVGDELRKAQKDLIDFQLTHGVIDISSQAQEQSRLLASLRSEVIRNELEIQTLSEYLLHNDPRIIRLRQEIEKKNQLITELKTGLNEFSGEFIPQNEIPSLTTQYFNLRAELDIQKNIYSMLRQEYEKVKIEETDNSQILQILEPAEVPELKAGPNRSGTCMIITIIAFFLSLFWAFAKEFVERVKKDPIESKKLSNIKAMLSLRKRK